MYVIGQRVEKTMKTPEDKLQSAEAEFRLMVHYGFEECLNGNPYVATPDYRL